MNKRSWFYSTLRSPDPLVQSAVQDWIGMYELCHVMAEENKGFQKGKTEARESKVVAEDVPVYPHASAEMPAPEDLWAAVQSAARVLNAAGTKYVLGGGLSVNMHGQRRATKDVDFFILEDPENLGPLQQALASRDLRPHRFEQPSFMPPDALFWWEPLQYGLPDAPPVDVDLLVARHEFMAMLHATGKETEVNGERVRILGLEGLLVLKLKAFRDKDRWDFKQIMKAHSDLDRSLLEVWVQKFKLEERLAQMERELKEEGGRRFG